MTRMLAVDIEGDGQNPSNPVQIGISEMEDFRMTGRRFAWTVKPPGPISFYATRVHGIRDVDVASFGSIAGILDELADVLKSDPIVGHAVRGDYASLKRVLPDWEPVAGYDTFRMAKSLRPGLASYKLVGVGEALGLIDAASAVFPGGAHTAPFDAELAGLIAESLVRDLSPKAFRHVLTQSNIFNFRAGRRLRASREDPDLFAAPSAPGSR